MDKSAWAPTYSATLRPALCLEAVIRKLTKCHGICDKRRKKNRCRAVMPLSQTRAVCADSLNWETAKLLRSDRYRVRFRRSHTTLNGHGLGDRVPRKTDNRGPIIQPDDRMFLKWNAGLMVQSMRHLKKR